MSVFFQRKLDRLEKEVASLLEQGLPARAAEKQREICGLVKAHRDDDVDACCDQLARLAEIQLLAGCHQQARETWRNARRTLRVHLRERCPELLDPEADEPGEHLGMRHRTLDYDLGTARRLNRLAMLYHRAGRHTRARPLLERAMAIARPRLGVDHPDFAILLANLAGVEHATGGFAAAESLYRQALDVLRTRLGEEHPEVAETQGELAQVFHDRGMWEEALRWYEKTLETLGRAYGENHSALVEVLRKEAVLRIETGDFTAAEWNLVKARRILGTRSGRDPREVSILQHLTEVYRRMKDYGKAAAYGREALDLQRRLRGRDHADCAVTANNLATLYHQMDRLAEARTLYEEACRILRAAPQAPATRLVSSLANLALLHEHNGNHRAREAIRREIERIRRDETEQQQVSG